MRKNRSCDGRSGNYELRDLNESVPILEDEVGFDRLLGFTIPDRNARGRVVRLGPILDEILGAHPYPPQAKILLAEALVLTVLMGGLLKDAGDQLTLQAQADDAVISLLICDYRDGELRGYVQLDEEKLSELGDDTSLEALFGADDSGRYLALTFDLAGSGQRYQGIVPLEGDTLTAACEAYFSRSEQVPTQIRLGIQTDRSHLVAGGLLLQHLPEGEDGRERLHVRMDHPEWEHVALLAGSTRHDELVDPTLSLEALIWRLFHEEREVRVQKGASIARGCRCTLEHYQNVLSRFPEEERAAMRNESGQIIVDCAFCSRLFSIEV